jgi:hypothetical protein
MGCKKEIPDSLSYMWRYSVLKLNRFSPLS